MMEKQKSIEKEWAVNNKETLLAAAHRGLWLRSLQNRNRNHNFSIISNACVGGFIYRDLNLPYLTPTVNLSISASDFIKLCNNLEFYMERELVEVQAEHPYPVGQISDIIIQFIHYNTFEEAREAWNRRKKRIRYDNIFIVMKEGKHLTSQNRKDFHQLPYPKVLLVSHQTSVPNEFYISGFEDKKCLGDIISFQKPGFRYFEQFDFVEFLNTTPARDGNVGKDTGGKGGCQ